MKVWSNEHVFNHSWETIVKASWRKYPNPMNTSVTGIDIIDRELVDNTLFTHRLITSQWCFPSWSKKIIGSSQYCYASEESVVDRNARTMTMKTNNITFSDLIRVEETVIYEADPECPQTRTRMRQEATVRVQNVPFSSSIEDMLTSKIMANAMKGRQAIEWVVKKVDLEMMPDLGAISHLHTDSC